MSFSRWSDLSSLYIFHDYRGYVTCFACHFEVDPEDPVDEHGFPFIANSFNTTDVDEMLDHVQRHIDAGDDVPEGLMDKLRHHWPKDFSDT